MTNALRVAAFILIVVGGIAGFASLIPQVQSPAPEVIEISGTLSGAELAALGEEVFQSAEAGCLACHAVGREGLRAPDVAGIGARAGERVPGQTATQYLYESLEDPCAFVVEGYDCIMPLTLGQALGPAKVTALVAYLESLGGTITVSLEGGSAAREAEAGAGGPVGVAGSTAEAIIAGVGCVACHQIDALDAQGVVGPDLSQIGARLTPEEIRQSLLVPDAVIAAECPTGPCAPGIMPKTLGDQLSAAQLETLVTFLSSLGGPIESATASGSE